MAASPSTRIRRATLRDLDYIQQRWKLLVGDLMSNHVHFRLSRHAPELARQRLLTQLDDPDARILLAQRGTKRVGFLQASILGRNPMFPKEEVGLIENMFVEPGLRRARIGTDLLQHAVAWFRSRKVRAVEAVTSGTNPDATTFFGSHGFDILSVTLLLDIESGGEQFDAAVRRSTGERKRG